MSTVSNLNIAKRTRQKVDFSLGCIRRSSKIVDCFLKWKSKLFYSESVDKAKVYPAKKYNTLRPVAPSIHDDNEPANSGTPSTTRTRRRPISGSSSTPVFHEQLCVRRETEPRAGREQTDTGGAFEKKEEDGRGEPCGRNNIGELDRDVDDYCRVNERAVIGCGKLVTRLTSHRSFATRSPVQPWPLIVVLNITEQRACLRACTRVYVSRGNCRKIRWFSDTSGRSGTRVSRRLLTVPDPRLRKRLV